VGGKLRALPGTPPVKKEKEERMKEIAWEHVSENLREALGELQELVARAEYHAFGALRDGCLEDMEEGIARQAWKRPLSEGSLSVSFEHAQHHLNFAWNCRHAEAGRIRRCEWGDFVRWSRFPRAGAFRGLASVPPKNFERGSGRIDPAAMHPFLQLAMRKLETLSFLVDRHCGRDAGRAPEGLRAEVVAALFGEEEFARRLRGVCEMMTAAWDHRKRGGKGRRKQGGGEPGTNEACPGRRGLPGAGCGGERKQQTNGDGR